MNKIKYIEPKIAIIAFENEDVIIASNGNIEFDDDDFGVHALGLGTSVYD